jgi:photosystem I reaction center subunit VIII
MALAFLPSLLVPLIGLVFPRISIRAFFIYAEKEYISLLSILFSMFIFFFK